MIPTTGREVAWDNIFFQVPKVWNNYSQNLWFEIRTGFLTELMLEQEFVSEAWDLLNFKALFVQIHRQWKREIEKKK